MKKSLLTFLVFLSQFSFAYLTTNPDSIRGALRHERTCFDVTFYDLEVDIDPKKKRIVGSNNIYFTTTDTTRKIQIDLFRQYKIVGINLYVPIDTSGLEEVVNVTTERVEDAIFVSFPNLLKKGKAYRLKISYHGIPNVAKKAPWDGGFVWDKDSLGRYFCGVACEGLGASSWWPCKDHLSDEPDSLRVRYLVPTGYQCIGNGELVSKDHRQELGGDFNSWDVFEWKVTNPINTYNVTFYIGMYDKVEGWYISGGDSLKTEFYALDYNIEKAREQFKQVHPMLKVYEELFGKYPFWNDGYKLVEAPYLGMEHQSAIAYGNKYKKGYLGNHPEGIEFDYIIIHESGHEYWGNSVSMNDLADMWIHEGLCTYSEVLYTEKIYGKEAAINYLKNQRVRMSNDEPVIGVYGINTEGSGDMYNKGSWMLHTVRNFVNNDSLWFKTLKQFSLAFKHRNTNSIEVLDWFEVKLGNDVRLLMERFLYHADIPVLQYKQQKKFWKKSVFYKWKTENENFTMPILIVGRKGDEIVTPTSNWQKIRVKNFEGMRHKLSWEYALYDIEEFKVKKKE